VCVVAQVLQAFSCGGLVAWVGGISEEECIVSKLEKLDVGSVEVF
jgi:hypothetical protein